MNHEHTGFTGGQILLAFLGGAAAGAAVALLTAPKRGAEVRKEIASTVRDGTERAKLLPEAMKNAADAAKGAFSTTMHHG